MKIAQVIFDIEGPDDVDPEVWEGLLKVFEELVGDCTDLTVDNIYGITVKCRTVWGGG